MAIPPPHGTTSINTRVHDSRLGRADHLGDDRWTVHAKRAWIIATSTNARNATQMGNKERKED